MYEEHTQMKQMLDQHNADIADLKEKTKIWPSYFNREFVEVAVGAFCSSFFGFLNIFNVEQC
jgi:tetrahydromethanopterin S-methyltransferase subunit B